MTTMVLQHLYLLQQYPHDHETLEGILDLLVDTCCSRRDYIRVAGDDRPVTLSDLMAKVIQDKPIEPGEGILHHPEGVDLVPANIALAGTLSINVLLPDINRKPP